MNKQMDELVKVVDQIEGWLWNDEPVALIHLPLLIDHLPGAIVEIGSYRGKSTVALGFGSALLSSAKRPIYAIDPFIPDNNTYFGNYFEIFWNNITNAGLASYVIPIMKYSTEAYYDCPSSIALLFIDGNHEYSAVKHDIVHYVPRVVKGGFIAFHDYALPYCEGVTQAVDELMNPREYEHVCDHYSLRVYRKLN